MSLWSSTFDFSWQLYYWVFSFLNIFLSLYAIKLPGLNKMMLKIPRGLKSLGCSYSLRYYSKMLKIYTKKTFFPFSNVIPSTLNIALYCGTHIWLCVQKMLNHGLNHGFFISLFKLISFPIHWIVCVLACLDFIFVFQSSFSAAQNGQLYPDT